MASYPAMRPYQRVLLYLLIFIAALLIIIWALPSKAHAESRSRAKTPAEVIEHARQELSGPPVNASIDQQFLKALNTLSTGQAWEPEARAMLEAVAKRADAIVNAVSPYAEPQAPYPSYIAAEACWARADAKLYLALSTLRTFKGKEVSGRSRQEVASLLQEVIDDYRCASEKLVQPSTFAEFVRRIGSAAGASNKINEDRDIIAKNVFLIQDGQSKMKDGNQSESISGDTEMELMKRILGDRLGKKATEGRMVVPPQQSNELRDKRYSPGGIGGI